MSNIDKQALRGQSVEGSFYLAECGYCGQIMPSSKLLVLHSPDGEADCYCPHCNAEDCEIFDLGNVGSEVVNAWNYQQKRIEALLDELEAAEKRGADMEIACELYAESKLQQIKLEAANAAQDDHINQQADRIESLEKKNGELGRALGAAEQHIAELEANQGSPVMFIDGDISPADADKLAAVIREFNEETETPAARMARIIRENPHPTNECDMPSAGSIKGSE